LKFFLLLLLIYNFLDAEDFIEFDYEGDIYYSNVSAFIDLDTANEVADYSLVSEFDIYSDLLMQTLEPNIFLVEFAVHPMPILGVYLRDKQQESYNSYNNKKSNIIQSVTAGFNEPYSFSLFFGRMAIFKNEHSKNIGKNRAYIGYLFTVGDRSIKDNIVFDNRWINVEFKLKGTREKLKKDLDWSFRVGYQVNSAKDIVDTLYVGARRSSIDYKKSIYSFKYNSAFSTMIEVDAKKFHLTTAEFILEKKFPIGWSEKMVFGLGIGYIFNSNRKYLGKLKKDGIENHQFVFRPNLKF